MEAVLGGLEYAPATRGVPPRVYRRIVRRMKEEYGGMKIRRKHEYSLVMWTPRKLLSLHPST